MSTDQLLLLAAAVLFAYGLAEMFWLTMLRRSVPFKRNYSQLLKNSVVANTFGAMTLPLLGTAALAPAGTSLAPFSLGHDGNGR